MSACSRRPTASSAARPGTWTSSTSWAGSRSSPDDITVQFHNADGDIEFKPAAIHVGEKVHLDHTIFAEDFEFLQDTVAHGKRRS